MDLKSAIVEINSSIITLNNEVISIDSTNSFVQNTKPILGNVPLFFESINAMMIKSNVFFQLAAI